MSSLEVQEKIQAQTQANSQAQEKLSWAKSSSNSPIIVVGKKMRDEFLCPITFELMIDPVIASDGHTYERSAIEKWLKSSQISPRSGETITTTLLPNINLRKLIQDMCQEGGLSLYTCDTENVAVPRTIEIIKSKHLLFECLGPPESDWNQLTFLVSPQGCRGGRSHNVDSQQSQKELFLFKDITISRKHFEIFYQDQKYYFKDLGSAGGSYIRIPSNTKRVLEENTIIMIGKHQFSVSFRDIDAYQSNSNSNTPTYNSNYNKDSEKDDEKYKDNTLDFSGMSISDINNKDKNIDDVIDIPLETNKTKTRHENKLCVLKCSYPDGSPFLNQEFVITQKGASIGRKTTNDIPLARSNKEDKFIDNAVSAEHARIDFNPVTQQYYIVDGGSNGTPSTNGTWFRLSAVQKPSEDFLIYNGMEILIGTVRFKVREVNSIIERNVDV